jgi:hypothetical protein
MTLKSAKSLDSCCDHASDLYHGTPCTVALTPDQPFPEVSSSALEQLLPSESDAYLDTTPCRSSCCIVLVTNTRTRSLLKTFGASSYPPALILDHTNSRGKSAPNEEERLDATVGACVCVHTG